MKINPQIELPEFKFTDLMVTNECSMEYITGNFSCAKGYFVLERELGIVLTTVEITISLYDYARKGYYYLNCFIPSFLCVLTSWLAFWVEVDVVDARLTLAIATFLTLTTQQSYLIQGLPKVSYVKAIDIWMTASTFFVFATLVEYAFAQYMFRKYKNNKQDCGVKSGCISDQANDENDDSGASRPSRSSVLKLLPTTHLKLSCLHLCLHFRLHF